MGDLGMHKASFACFSIWHRGFGDLKLRIRSKRAVPAHGFRFRNAGLRMQGNPSEGTDVLSVLHSSLPACLF